MSADLAHVDLLLSKLLLVTDSAEGKNSYMCFSASSPPEFLLYTAGLLPAGTTGGDAFKDGVLVAKDQL